MLWMSSNHLGHSFKLGSAKSSIIKRVVYPPSKRCFQRSVRKQIDVVRFSVLKGLFLKSASVLSTSLFGWILHTFKMSEIFFLSFQDVNFPTVIVCNINQIRRSLFRGLGVTNESDIELLYSQFYTGMSRNLTQDEQDFIHKIATSEVCDKKLLLLSFFSSRERQNLYWYLRTLL